MNKAKHWGVGVQQNNVFLWNKRYNMRSHTSCEIMLLVTNDNLLHQKMFLYDLTFVIMS
jgi:hypothetical protein